MDGTRRYWIGIGLAGALAVSAVLTARPLLLLGAAMIGASLLARQYVFVRSLLRTADHLAIEEAAGRETIVTEETTTVTLRVSDPLKSSLDLTVESRPPVPTRVSGERSVRLTAETREGRTIFEVTWPVAGTFRFDTPRVTVVRTGRGWCSSAGSPRDRSANCESFANDPDGDRGSRPRRRDRRRAAVAGRRTREAPAVRARAGGTRPRTTGR